MGSTERRVRARVSRFERATATIVASVPVLGVGPSAGDGRNGVATVAEPHADSTTPAEAMVAKRGAGHGLGELSFRPS